MIVKKELITSASFAAIVFFVMRWQGAPLKTPTTPTGIIELELAGNAGRLHEVLSVWLPSVPKANIWLDFVFIVSYVLFFSIASDEASRRWSQLSLQRAGWIMARLAYLAGVLDICENLLMLQSIAGHYSSVSLQLTYYCATIKFILLAFVGIYVVISLPKLFMQKK